ncbi:hypothetical protein QKU48_gp1076 [Fadolivirus algeromassiliense]|jgi:hypothetical protein|uniref:Uncharacterized protein n=1 Tax=Fadolivirus FV1/VV64 TaxID=3070911 RepID=A0A7D3UW22_9VIRU|nr:hypothetical protein QKU48_gp1076 [Fadolivirus algeromassiliense]QKF94534.1 hypothetical protein Fadolivirus_1_1076 [Fadolivirus FV1/VV64]
MSSECYSEVYFTKDQIVRFEINENNIDYTKFKFQRKAVYDIAPAWIGYNINMKPLDLYRIGFHSYPVLSQSHKILIGYRDIFYYKCYIKMN